MLEATNTRASKAGSFTSVAKNSGEPRLPSVFVMAELIFQTRSKFNAETMQPRKTARGLILEAGLIKIKAMTNKQIINIKTCALSRNTDNFIFLCP